MTELRRYRMRCPRCRHKATLTLPNDAIGVVVSCESGSCEYQWIATNDHRNALERIDGGRP